MNRAIATPVFAVLLGLSLVSSRAVAEERTTDAALGAVSGAVVLGPIGAVAGALVGYTAGPAISHSWGARRSNPPRQARRSARPDAQASMNTSMNNSEVAPSVQAGAPPAASARAASPAPQTASAPPPVQPLE